MSKKERIHKQIAFLLGLCGVSEMQAIVSAPLISTSTDIILEITKPKPRKLSEEKYRKELLRRGVKFTESKFQRHWKSAKSILESDVWEDER